LQHAGQSEPAASMTAPVGSSVHRMMDCIFHLPLHPTLTNILPQSIVLPPDLLPFFFPNPDPPYYPPT